MRRRAFLAAMCGLFILALLLTYCKTHEVRDYAELENLEVNAKVSLTGKVVEERVIYQGTKVLELGNGIELVCECAENFEDAEIVVGGIVSEYDGKRQVTVQRIARSDFQ